MDRWACLNIRALPLQLLLAAHPEWAELPVVVVDRDAPNGIVTWANGRARRKGIGIGLRYASALGLCAELQASVVPDETVQAGLASIMKQLRDYTPEVEPSDETPGVIWLNAAGLRTLYRTERSWARRLAGELRSLGFHASLAVGFTRFGTYAVSTVRRDVTIFDDPSDEECAAREVPLGSLDLTPAVVETLGLLGIGTVAEFLRLPRSGVQQRFGAEAATLHRRASGDIWSPIQPEHAEPPLFERVELDDPESDRTRLLVLITRMVKPLIGRLARKGNVCEEVRWMFALDNHERHGDGIKPAAPTADLAQIADLLSLRLENTELHAGVMTVIVVVQAAAPDTGQLTLFSTRTRRDLDAANRALARLRAEFGTRSIVTAALRDAHLPEARFSWEPLHALRPPRPPDGATFSPLVRRIYDRSQPLSPYEVGEFADVAGPHVISGGWWTGDDRRGGVYREYHFALNAHGRLLWLYYDHAREHWFAQGEVG